MNANQDTCDTISFLSSPRMCLILFISLIKQPSGSPKRKQGCDSIQGGWLTDMPEIETPFCNLTNSAFSLHDDANKLHDREFGTGKREQFLQSAEGVDGKLR